MITDALLDWLRGPGFWAALTFMILGLARHLAITSWGLVRAYRRAGDRTLPVRQLWTATMRWMLPVGRLGRRPIYGITTFVFHLSVIIVPLFLAGHIALWRNGLGISWPAIPNGLATTLTIVAVGAAVAIVVQRLATPASRALSRYQDLAIPLLVVVPFVSGFLVMHPAYNPISHQAAMLLHVASANLLMFLVPLTKLSHMVLLPATQVVSELAWHFPPDAGSRVGEALGKANESI